MFEPIVIALAALGLSASVTSVKLISWFLRSDPRVVAKPAAWFTMGLALVTVVLLLVLLIRGQWAAAIELVAAMLITGTFFGSPMLRQWQKLFRFRRRGLSPDTSRPVAANGAGVDGAPPDPDLVRQSIAVLEDYLHKSLAEPWEGRANVQSAKPRAGRNGQGNGKSKDSGSMSEEEALEILGLRQGAEVWEIEEAHRRMVRKVHPDQGGSNYLTIKVNEAHDLLLGGAKGPARPRPTGSAQKPRPSQRSN